MIPKSCPFSASRSDLMALAAWAAAGIPLGASAPALVGVLCVSPGVVGCDSLRTAIHLSPPSPRYTVGVLVRETGSMAEPGAGVEEALRFVILFVLTEIGFWLAASAAAAAAGAAGGSVLCGSGEPLWPGVSSERRLIGESGLARPCPSPFPSPCPISTLLP